MDCKNKKLLQKQVGILQTLIIIRHHKDSNMFFDFLIQVFVFAYRWLDNNFISHVLNFARGFEYAIIIFAAITFLLICIAFTLRNARKLPRSYSIEVVDIYGERANIDGLRLHFKTFSAAQSYAEHYNQAFNYRYKFKVVGKEEPYDFLKLKER